MHPERSKQSQHVIGSQRYLNVVTQQSMVWKDIFAARVHSTTGSYVFSLTGVPYTPRQNMSTPQLHPKAVQGIPALLLLAQDR